MGRPKQGYAKRSLEKVPGVTNVLGIIAKPALIGWSGKKGVEAGYAAGRAGKPIPEWRDAVYGERDKAATDGSVAHTLFEMHLRGQDVTRGGDDSDGAWTAHVGSNAWESYCSDAAWRAYCNAVHWLDGQSARVEVWPHERPLVSEVHGFGGTPDALMRRGDVIYLADWKTGSVFPEQIAQLAAYRHLLQEVEGIHVEGAHLVRFHREHGDFHHHSYASDALDVGWVVFKHALALHRAMQELGKRVK